MRQQEREWLSALVDGELQGQELARALERLRDDPQLLVSWRAYHVIRDAATSNLDDAMDLQLHRRVSEALDSEPTILAPQRRRPRWIKQAAGVAIAASVTGVAIIGVQRMNSVEHGPAALPIAQQQEYLRMEPTLVAHEEAKPAHNKDALNPYLVNHNEFSANSGIQGMLPYVRIVGHKEGR